MNMISFKNVKCLQLKTSLNSRNFKQTVYHVSYYNLISLSVIYLAIISFWFTLIYNNFILVGGGNEHVKFMMTKTGNESITDQINNLRNWIGETINVHPGRILLTSLYQQTEPVAVTFMMRDKHAKSLLDLVKTDDGQIALCRKGIEKIIHDDNVFKIGKLK